MRHCPDKQTLFDFTLGEEKKSRRHTLREHIDHCSECQRAVSKMTEQQQAVRTRLSMLEPDAVPYLVWKQPETVQTEPGWRHSPVWAATAACVIIAALVSSQLIPRCSEPATQPVWDQYMAETPTDALDDWHQKRLTITLVQDGASEARVIQTALSPDEIRQATVHFSK